MAMSVNRFSRLVLMTTLAACALPGCNSLPKKVSSEKRGEIKSHSRELRAFINDRLERYKAAGVSVALIGPNGVLWSDGFGYSDIAGKVPATPETVYRVGSLSKLLTATAVMQMDQGERLDIDSPVHDYLPQFGIKSRYVEAGPITPRQLLTHHAGLPGDLNQGMWSSQPFTGVTGRLQQEWAAYPPGLVSSYSNVGYDVLGHMVENVSGERFQDYMKGALFNPLGMTHSAYVETPRIQRLLARGYRNGQAEELLPMRDLPALGLYASAMDLSRFVQMVINRGEVNGRRILAAEQLDEMFEVQNENVALDYDVRMGLSWFQDPGGLSGVGPVERHGGVTMLFNSQMIVLPRHQLGVVVLSNSANTRRMVTEIAEFALRGALQDYAGVRLPEAPAADAPQLAEASSAHGHVSPGRYITPMGLLGVRPDSAEVKAFSADRTLDMVVHEDGSFGMRASSFGSASAGLQRLEKLRFFTEQVEGREVMVVVDKGQRKLFGEKVVKQPLSAVWRQRLGHYVITNANPRFPVDQVCLQEKDGLLYYTYRMPKLSQHPVSVAIRPVSDTEAVVMGLGRGKGVTLSADERNGSQVLHYSGHEAVMVPRDG